MKKYIKIQDLVFAAVCCVLAGEIVAVADIIRAFSGKALSLKLFVMAMLLLAVILFALSRKHFRKWIWGAAAFITAAAAILTVLFAGWYHFSTNAVYENVDTGKGELFSGKKIMIIVPHEDDEVNIMGGAVEAYRQNGSDVYVVFVTNGDFDFSADVRIGEAVAAMECAGVPENHLIFLGYGDQWASGGPHLYNAEPDTVLVSAAGMQQTYGTEDHPAYRTGRDYTSQNLLDDLTAVILEYRPEIIFCSDYDVHIDHRAVSLAFDKVMGRILKEEPDYRPGIFKGYAYGTAWAAEPDYHTVNILSTKNLYEEPAMQSPRTYSWEERVRIPVQADVLSRSLFSSAVYRSLEAHASQNADMAAMQIINGDKVFWYRDPNSMTYGAELRVTSGDAKLLRDFMLVDDHSLTDEDLLPCDGVWIPEKTDEQKEILFSFKDPVNIESVVLYDHPSETENILNMEICFSDGTSVETGPLKSGGAASSFQVDKTAVKWMRLRIVDWEGDTAGLSEVETFETVPRHEMTYIKLMDTEESFAYDYWTGRDGKAEFLLYVSGSLPEASAEDYEIRCDNERCSVTWAEGKILVDCPAGERAVLTVTGKRDGISDSIVVSNPGTVLRMQTASCQWLERLLANEYHRGWHEKTVLYRIGAALLR